jgi:pseudouridine-5'-phosphate glycosidase
VNRAFFSRGGEPIAINEEVRTALADGAPLVALESTIVTHGMPYPANAETAAAVEATVRTAGAVPATVAVIEGQIRIGLSAAELLRLASLSGVEKASRRDLAALVARRASGGTTVAATMLIAAKAGIAIFATGGIGGVHRGAATTFDVSTDLRELGRTPVAVVCAGCKSILDIPKTLEVLETEGVPVLGYGADEFPAFFSRTSGCAVARRCDTPRAVADIIRAQRRLGLDGGILIANPIPEADALPAAEIEASIAAAVVEAEAAGVAGKALTPFLLARVNELTAGRSLTANIALVKNNARLAAEIAADLASLMRAA